MEVIGQLQTPSAVLLDKHRRYPIKNRMHGPQRLSERFGEVEKSRARERPARSLVNIPIGLSCLYAKHQTTQHTKQRLRGATVFGNVLLNCTACTATFGVTRRLHTLRLFVLLVREKWR